MNNAGDEAQHIVLLGGTSDIGLAIVRRLVSTATRRVTLACRDRAAGDTAAAALLAEQPAGSDLAVEVIGFDGAEPSSHEAFVADLVARHGDIDVAVVAFAQLGGAATARDPQAAAQLATVNFTGNVSAIVAVAEQMRRQGHGSIVVLSSVAGERVRAANPVYGGTKAGLDGFCQGLGDDLAGDGVHMLVVRPGFVHSAMTEGMAAAPFATTPDAVAAATVAALRRRRRMVWAPGILRVVFSVLRHLPGPVWRRLPLG
jgi:decaprenylphospho-beta-D-erythro-pentofuranosid-2-ulose 2-reductase